MKHLLITFCLLLGFNLESQEESYLPVISKGKKWTAIAGSFGPWTSFQFTYSEDSILMDGKYYHERLWSRNEDGSDAESGGYFREEGGKVYLKLWENEPEYLYLDMTLEYGDSIVIAMEYYDAELYVKEIDTVTFFDGIDRKRIIMDCVEYGGYNYTWIEGLGFWNYHDPICGVDGDVHELICMSIDDEVVYHNENYDDCWVYTSTLNLKETGLEIFPNPADDRVFLSNLEKDKDHHYEIYNTSGQLLSSGKLKEEEIRLPDDHIGVFIIKIRNEDGMGVYRIVGR